MATDEMAQLQLLAEVDALLGRLRRWADAAPPWQAAETPKALIGRLAERAATLKVRLAAPLVVATLGGTGTGKSALVNALLGEEVVSTGRRRPTTTRPMMVCRSGASPEALGIDPGSVDVVHRDLPVLANLVLIDCPDPDTSEYEGAEDFPTQRVPSTEAPTEGGVVNQRPLTPALSRNERGSNLARLRGLLPHCDVLLVTATQQKYRSARVADELDAAAGGARLVFVQTHADVDEDVRDDWRAVLERHYCTGQLFLVDSLAALDDARNGLAPRGQFAELVDLLTRRLAGTAAARIRRANFLDLVDEALANCRELIDTQLPAVAQLRTAIDEQRAPLAAELAENMQDELLTCRRQWESRLLGQVVSRWGFSPFSLVLRLYHGLGGLIAGRLLWKARTPAQIALWGAVQGARSLNKRRKQRTAEQSGRRAVAGCWDPAELRKAALVLDGYAAEAGLNREATNRDVVAAEADRAAGSFVADASGQLQSLLGRLARRHTGWFTRWRYELALIAMLGVLLYRLGRNFFYDSWLGGENVPVFGLDFYISAGFWLGLWCLVLIWLFTGRLRRGLRREIAQMADRWKDASPAAGVFAGLEQQCDRVERFVHDLDRLHQHVDRLRKQLASAEGPLGHRL